MAKVDIIDFTGSGRPDQREYAGRLLAFTKNTRLAMTPDGFNVWINEKPWSDIIKELNYMATTIPSSWEFAEVTFSIEGVTRACAQQITRTRQASYAMQSQRVTDMREVAVAIPEGLNGEQLTAYSLTASSALKGYSELVEAGTALEDARGILPLNTRCNLIAKYNLRTLVDLLRARQSLRVQGEYQDIAAQMRAAILAIWPWTETFFVPKHAQAIALIEDIAKTLPQDQQRQLAKAADLLKKAD